MKITYKLNQSVKINGSFWGIINLAVYETFEEAVDVYLDSRKGHGRGETTQSIFELHDGKPYKWMTVDEDRQIVDQGLIAE